MKTSEIENDQQLQLATDWTFESQSSVMTSTNSRYQRHLNVIFATFSGFFHRGTAIKNFCLEFQFVSCFFFSFLSNCSFWPCPWLHRKRESRHFLGCFFFFAFFFLDLDFSVRLFYGFFGLIFRFVGFWRLAAAICSAVIHCCRRRAWMVPFMQLPNSN